MADERKPEVILVQSGWTADRKPMFDVIPVYQVPCEKLPKDHRDNQHGELKATFDEFHIVRPATG